MFDSKKVLPAHNSKPSDAMKINLVNGFFGKVDL
jgi:hypothetical protein